MHYLLFTLVFVLGVVIGSFLNVLIDRLPRREDAWFSRSRCENCHKILNWFDLMPVVSYFLLGGKCRYCKSLISQRLIWIEILTGAGFLFVFFYFFYSTLSITWLIYSLLLFSFLEVVFFTDAFYGIIPDSILIILGVVSFVYEWFFSPSFFLINLFAGVSALLFFFFLYLITKGRGMGLGDVKLVFLLGFILGFKKTVFSLYLSFLTASLISIMLVLLKKKKLRGDTIAFGPFLVLGFLILYFWGDRIVSLIGFL